MRRASWEDAHLAGGTGVGLEGPALRVVDGTWRGLREIPVSWVGAKVAVAEKEGVNAPVAFFPGKAAGKIVVDLLGETALFGLCFSDAPGLLQHVVPPAPAPAFVAVGS